MNILSSPLHTSPISHAAVWSPTNGLQISFTNAVGRRPQVSGRSLNRLRQAQPDSFFAIGYRKYKYIFGISRFKHNLPNSCGRRPDGGAHGSLRLASKDPALLLKLNLFFLLEYFWLDLSVISSSLPFFQ